MNIEDLIKEYGLEYLISEAEDIEYLTLIANKISARDFSFFDQIEREVSELFVLADNKELCALIEQYNKSIRILSDTVNKYCESLLGGGVLWSSTETERDGKRLVADFYLHIGEIGEIYERLTGIELNISGRQLQTEEIFASFADIEKRIVLLTLLFDIFKLDKKKIEEKKAELVGINELLLSQSVSIKDFLAITSINRGEIGNYILKADNASRGTEKNQMNKDEIIRLGLNLIKSLVQCKT